MNIFLNESRPEIIPNLILITFTHWHIVINIVMNPGLYILLVPGLTEVSVAIQRKTSISKFPLYTFLLAYKFTFSSIAWFIISIIVSSEFFDLQHIIGFKGEISFGSIDHKYSLKFCTTICKKGWKLEIYLETFSIFLQWYKLNIYQYRQKLA